MFNIDLAALYPDEQETGLTKETYALLDKYSKLPTESEYAQPHWKQATAAYRRAQVSRKPASQLTEAQLLEVQALYLRNLNRKNLKMENTGNVQLGTVIEGSAEFYNRLTRKQRSRNIVDEIFLKDERMREQVDKQKGEILDKEYKTQAAKKRMQSSMKGRGKKSAK